MQNYTELPSSLGLLVNHTLGEIPPTSTPATPLEWINGSAPTAFEELLQNALFLTSRRSTPPPTEVPKFFSPVTLSPEWSRMSRLLLLSALCVFGSVGNVFMISSVVIEDYLKRPGNLRAIARAPFPSASPFRGHCHRRGPVSAGPPIGNSKRFARGNTTN